MTPVPPHDIVRAVRAELAVPGRYQLHVAVRRPSLLEVLADWLGDRYRAFERALAAHVHVTPAAKTAFGDLIVVAAVLAVAIVAARLLAQAQIDAAQRGDAHSLSPARSAHVLSVRAAAAAAEGDYARAVRTLFAAAVTLLDLRGVVRDDESATVNDLRRALHERDGRVEAPFIELARIYTSVAYAEAPTGADAWERAQRAYGDLSRSASV